MTSSENIGHGNYIPVVVPPGARRIGKDGRVDELCVCKDGCAMEIVLEQGAEVNICVAALPGAKGEIRIDAYLVGEGAKLSLSGLYLLGGGESVSILTAVHHLAGGCISHQEFDGIASGDSKAKFHGIISVAPLSQKTEALQSNRNIIIGRKAVVDTRPQLEIYADDVKCSHGATIGKLDEQEQFYMRSRGIPVEEARRLQMISFLAPVIETVARPQLRKRLKGLVDRAIRKIAPEK